MEILAYLAVSPANSQVSKVQLTAEDGCENGAGVMWAGGVLTSCVLTASVLEGTSREVGPLADFYLLSLFCGSSSIKHSAAAGLR